VLLLCSGFSLPETQLFALQHRKSQWRVLQQRLLRTIHPDGGGNITMVFNYSGYLTYAGTNYLSQRVTLAPQATFHDGGSILRSGLAAYPDSRWGDYTGTAWDGSNVWFSGMYANSSGTWNTGIGKTGYTAATQP
jgi:hypothetical protein